MQFSLDSYRCVTVKSIRQVLRLYDTASQDGFNPGIHFIKRLLFVSYESCKLGINEMCRHICCTYGLNLICWL